VRKLEIMANKKNHPNNNRLARLITALCLTAVLAGCSQKSPRVYKVAYAKPNSAKRIENGTQTQEATSKSQWVNTTESGRYLIKSTVGSVSPSWEYHLGPGDELEIQIWQLLEFNQSDFQRVRVDDQGQIYLTVLNKVQAEGLTIEQLRQDLVRRLSIEFIKNPEISVAVTKFRSKEVVVLGEVRSPGKVYLKTNNASLLDVISLANGVTNSAAPNIEILRGASQADLVTWNTDSPQTYFHRDVVPISTLYAEGGTQNNPIIFPGDVVKIRSSSEGYVYVSGEVIKPGTKPYRRPLNIMQAITSSGGFNTIAEEKEVKIIRRLSSGHEQTIMVDFKKVRSGEHQNIQLAQNDLVIVPYNPDKKFWHDIGSFFRATVNTGVTVGYDAARGQPSGGSI
jgi:polysaccharide export outer membrane protein